MTIKEEVMRSITKAGILCGLILLAAVLAAPAAEACSVFRVTAKDGTILSGRTMEFGVDMKYGIVAVPRGREFVSPAPAAKTGLAWKTLYGYVASNVFGIESAVTDGMNEAGLTFSALWYESDTRYQSVGPREQGAALAHMMVGSWILGNFATVGEAATALRKVRVFGLVVPQMGMAPPGHFILYDARGGCIVVEYDAGELRIHENPLGVMTNAPNFPWMMTNLRNYAGMSNEQHKAETYAGVEIRPTGHGSGMFGLPGDITPPSRFVRLAVTTHFADPPEDAAQALNLTQHIVSSLQIVKGMAVDRAPDGHVAASETTQWATFRDITNRVYYFRTYDNYTLRKIDLKRLDFKGGKTRTIPMYGDAEVVTDITGRLK
jgi:choloylglycine hydrolase